MYCTVSQDFLAQFYFTIPSYSFLKNCKDIDHFRWLNAVRDNGEPPHILRRKKRTVSIENTTVKHTLHYILNLIWLYSSLRPPNGYNLKPLSYPPGKTCLLIYTFFWTTDYFPICTSVCGMFFLSTSSLWYTNAWVCNTLFPCAAATFRLLTSFLYINQKLNL